MSECSSSRLALFDRRREFFLDPLEDIWPQKAQIHQARLRDSGFSPFGNGRRLHAAKAGYFASSTKFVNDFVRVHWRILGTPNELVKECLIK